MLCEKCGRYLQDGQVCNCTQAVYTPSMGGLAPISFNRSILKWISLALAVLVFVFHLIDQYEFSVEIEGVREEFALSFGDFQSITGYAVVIFVVYLGCLFVGDKSNRTFDSIRRAMQIAFFALMFIAPIIFAIRMGSFMGDFDSLIELAEDEGVTIDTSLIVGWWLTVIFSFVGFVVSIIPEKSE